MPSISNLKKPACASKGDVLELATLNVCYFWGVLSCFLTNCICKSRSNPFRGYSTTTWSRIGGGGSEKSPLYNLGCMTLDSGCSRNYMPYLSCAPWLYAAYYFQKGHFIFYFSYFYFFLNFPYWRHRIIVVLGVNKSWLITFFIIWDYIFS